MDEFITVNSADKQYIIQIYKILLYCGLNMAKHGLFHWLKPYSKHKLRNDCNTNTVVLVKDITSGEYSSTFQMLVNEDGNLCVRKIATRPDFEGKGIGRKNMKYIEAYAKKKDCHYISLDVYKKSTRAVDFYKKLGFVIIGETKDRFFNVYLMEKKII